MDIDERDIRRTTEDLHFNPVAGPAKYGNTAEGPVRVVTVANNLGRLGFLWAADPDSAGFVPIASAGDDAMNASVAWARKLREAKANGLTPVQALEALTRDPGGEQVGRVVAGSEGQAPNLDELKALASNG